MELIETKISDLFLIKNFQAKDNRGRFLKFFHNKFFKDNNLNCNFKESYYSVSKNEVIRGMHFQLPPYDHDKLVFVANGSVTDVVLDLRKKSNTFGRFVSFELNSKNSLSAYIPKGCAHGFLSKKDNTIMVYNLTTVYNQKYDSGIKFDSFEFNWGNKEFIISEKDSNLIDFEEFLKNNPF